MSLSQKRKTQLMSFGVDESKFENLAEDEVWEIRLESAFREYDKIWNLLPPEVWRNYKILCITGLREQKLLHDAKEAIRTIWKERSYEANTKKPEKCA